MSDAEKAAQIGEAMLLLEQQKQALAHLVEKIDRVRSAYRTFAAERERWRVDATNPERVFLAQPRAEERELSSHLLSQADLAALIQEYQLAEGALRQTRAKLIGFGINTAQ